IGTDSIAKELRNCLQVRGVARALRDGGLALCGLDSPLVVALRSPILRVISRGEYSIGHSRLEDSSIRRDNCRSIRLDYVCHLPNRSMRRALHSLVFLQE